MNCSFFSEPNKCERPENRLKICEWSPSENCPYHLKEQIQNIAVKELQQALIDYKTAFGIELRIYKKTRDIWELIGGV